MIVAVCIASIGRQSLVAAVDSIREQVINAGYHLRIIIADDSTSGLVRSILADRLTADDRIIVVPAGERNIAAARNACLDAVGEADFVAFIDDDEVAEPTWLHELIDDMALQSADVIFGPVKPIFLDDCPDWAPSSGVFKKEPAAQVGPIRTGSTCNALMKWTDVVRPKRFDRSLGVTGGEDTQFFNELFQSGLKLAATDRGMVTERVPGARMDVASLRARYVRGGQSTARMMQRSLSRPKWFAFGLKATIKLLVFSVLVPLRFRMEKGRRIALRTRYWGSIGELRQVFGFGMRPFYAAKA